MERIGARDQPYLSLVQDFTVLHNRGGHFIVTGLHENETDAQRRLGRMGQRHPCLCVRVLSVNGRPLAPESGGARSLAEYELLAGELAVLSHAPSSHRFPRFVVTARASSGQEEEAVRLARAQPFYSMVCEVCLVEMEYGPCRGLRKTRDGQLCQAL